MKSLNMKWLLTSLLCVTVVAVVLGAGHNGPEYSLPERALVFPMTEVVTITPQKNTGSPVALFDSKTGAVYRLRGNRSNNSARVWWQLAIPPVDESSGLMQLEDVTPAFGGDFSPVGDGIAKNVFRRDRFRTFEIRDAETFLVDVISGDTYLFRENLTTNLEVGYWQPIKVFKYGKGNRTYSEMQ